MKARIAMGVVAVWLAPRVASGHCTTPEVVRPLFVPGVPDEIQMVFNFGAALSTNGGRSWRLQCEEVYQDPGEMLGPEAVRLLPDGTLIVAHFLYGVLTTGPVNRGCLYDRATGLEEGKGVKDVIADPRDPSHKVLVILEDEIRRSIDGGRSFPVVAASFPGRNLLGGAAVSGDGLTIVVGGFDAMGRFLARSTDGGMTFREARSPFGGDELVPLAVPPGAPDKLRVLHALDPDGDTNPDADALVELEWSAGTTLAARTLFQPPATALRGAGRLSYAAGGAAGEIWLGLRGDDKQANAGELHHSLDGGTTWTRVAGVQPHFRCLTWNEGVLWACGNNLVARGDAFSLGSSTDGGLTWQKRFAFGELCEALSCFRGKCDGVFRSSCVPGLCAAGPVDAGVRDAATDGGVVTGSGGGCCRASGARRVSPAEVLVIAGALALAVRRRRRR